MTSREEAKHPMTTRDELVVLADNIEGSGRFSFTSDYILLPCLHKRDRDLIASALRLASRQEVSVEELAATLYRLFVVNPHVDFNDLGDKAGWCAHARALLAEYSITKRTTER